MRTKYHRIVVLFPYVLQTLIWVPTRILLRFFLRLEIKGREHLKDLRGPIIFAPNHSSEWDPVVVPASLCFFSPFLPMFYTSREREFYGKRGFKRYFYGGFFFKVWGAYPVHVGKQNYALSLIDHLYILNNHKGSLCIFPEGGKSKDGTIGEGKGGVGFLAHQTKRPVVPVSISGYFNMTPKEFFLRRRRVTITFGKPLYEKELFNPIAPSLLGYKHAARRVMREVQKGLTTSSHFS